jgi:hypothetical protein
VAAAASPKAALALVRRVEGLVGVAVDVTELEAASADYERQVGIAVQSDPDVAAFVERLEQAAAEEEENPEDFPSGDVIAREFQRFLRQRGTDGQLGLDGPPSLGEQLGQGGQRDVDGEQGTGDQTDGDARDDADEQHGSDDKDDPEGERGPKGKGGPDDESGGGGERHGDDEQGDPV